MYIIFLVIILLFFLSFFFFSFFGTPEHKGAGVVFPVPDKFHCSIVLYVSLIHCSYGTPEPKGAGVVLRIPHKCHHTYWYHSHKVTDQIGIHQM